MSSTSHSFQDQKCSAGLQGNDQANPEYLLDLHSKEDQADAAFVNDLDNSTCRSSSQQSAIDTLRHLEDDKILGLLSIIRLPHHVLYPYSDGLSKEQIDALSHLKFCSDSLIRLWLRHSRVLAAGNHIGNSDVSGLPTPQRAVANGSRNPLRRPLNTTVRPSSNSPGHLLAYTNGTTHTRRGNCPGQHLFQDNSRRRAFAQEIYPPHITDRPAYVCVNMFCKNHRDCFVFKNCDGWRRHMKEHETVWPCMPNGACEISGTGLICVLCGSLNPNETHMTGHAMRDCGDTSTKPRNFSRRMNLEKHLSQSHAVPPHRTRGLAETWRKTLGKKNFACGFCICIFSTLHEQLNHIDNDHFKKGQQITEWSATNVVRGLLLSPEVAKSFQTMLSMEPYAIVRDLHWDKRSVEDLQRRLEIAEDTADTLASEAYQMLTCNLSRRDSYGYYASTSFPGTDVVGQSKAAISALDASAEGMGIKIDHQMEDIDRGSEHPWSSGCYHVEAPSTSCSITLYDWPTNPKGMSEVATIIEHQKGYDMVPRQYSPVRSSSRARSSSPHFPSQTVSESRVTGSSPTSAYNSSTTTPNWPVMPSSTLSSLHSTGAAEELREKLRIYEGSSLEYETVGTLNFDLGDLAELPGLEGVSLSLDSHDIGQIQQCSSQEQLNPYYDDDFEPEHVKKVMQIDRHYPMEPLTCDPRDLVKKTRWRLPGAGHLIKCIAVVRWIEGTGNGLMLAGEHATWNR